MSMHAATFSGSLLNAATDQPPVPVAVSPGLGPGSSETFHLSKSLPSCSFIVGHWNEPPRNIATVPPWAAVDIIVVGVERGHARGRDAGVDRALDELED